jgi:hypothetical protein
MTCLELPALLVENKVRESTRLSKIKIQQLEVPIHPYVKFHVEFERKSTKKLDLDPSISIPILILNLDLDPNLLPQFPSYSISLILILNFDLNIGPQL